ncbi:MAG: HD-GYP domain-containing protein [Candidatus Mcinerneyibacterium aminivorans]|uniref:HD-GYP domain-containing protein n=1 Tax=Candidatus Mcinerneyibacterium aminivorans TaxID=2703815 RepID=A0A5D0MDI5_9BACT|nr:MAG: HD-GYP domain-containing protein [Candidatus Mcinerneyibacterium aminivorans]
MIVAITELLSIHNRYTRGHSQNVAELAHDLADKMGLPQEELTKAYWAGMVHDIGKMLVTNQILDKKSNLNHQEYQTIKKHPIWGYKALKRTEELEELAVYVKHHHERWDGKGYPDGLKEEEIPLISQIISVVDAWDAMTSDRAYRKPLSDKQAIKQLKQKKGTQFSPRIVDVFVKMISQTIKS